MKIFFGLIIVQILNYIRPQVVLSYGNIIIKHFDDQLCKKKIADSIYPVETKCLEYNSTNSLYIKNWDAYSNAIQFYYMNNTDCNKTEEELESYPVGSITCNGVCGPSVFYQKKFFTCVYNNIIESATVQLKIYKGKSCSDNNMIFNKTFNGSSYCWDSNEFYSLMPLYWVDARKKLYYAIFKRGDCYGGNINLTEKFAICNGGCYKNETDLDYRYWCKFDAFGSFLQRNLLLLILIAFIV